MNLEQAKQVIKECAERMNARYEKVVFDEWAVVLILESKARILDYVGPRKDGFKRNFMADVAALRTGLLSQQYATGDFEFARHGVGTGFEVFMVLGNNRYLICNNTVQSMDEIAKDPHWLAAQVPFVELSDKFRQDALSA